MRCSFEFINLEAEKPIVVAMNAIAPNRGNGIESIGSHLRSTLVDENGMEWYVGNADVRGISIVGVGQRQWDQPTYDPSEIVKVLAMRDDLKTDGGIWAPSSPWKYYFIFGSMTEMSPGQSQNVILSFVQNNTQNTSGGPSKVFQMATEIVVGSLTSGSRKSYTLYNLTFDRVTPK
jgi:ABC-type transporter MlaC component